MTEESRMGKIEPLNRINKGIGFKPESLIGCFSKERLIDITEQTLIVKHIKLSKKVWIPLMFCELGWDDDKEIFFIRLTQKVMYHVFEDLENRNKWNYRAEIIAHIILEEYFRPDNWDEIRIMYAEEISKLTKNFGELVKLPNCMRKGYRMPLCTRYYEMKECNCYLRDDKDYYITQEEFEDTLLKIDERQEIVRRRGIVSNELFT